MAKILQYERTPGGIFYDAGQSFNTQKELEDINFVKEYKTLPNGTKNKNFNQYVLQKLMERGRSLSGGYQYMLIAEYNGKRFRSIGFLDDVSGLDYDELSC